MSASDQTDQIEPATPTPLPVPPLQSPLTLIADGASCSLDGTCAPA